MKNELRIRIKTLVLSAFIPLVISLIYMIITGFAPFGPKDFFSYSGTERVASFYFELWDSIHKKNTGLFFFSTRSGVGYDFSSVITMYLSNPLGLIFLLLPRDSFFVFSNFLYIFETSLSGISITYFIKKHNKLFCDDKCLRDDMVLCLSIVYSLIPLCFNLKYNSSSVIIVSLLPVVFLGIDKIVWQSKPLLYIVSMSCTIVLGFYMSMLIFLFSIIYLFILSLFYFEKALKSMFRKTIYDIFVVGLTMPIILNNVNSQFFKSEYSLDFKNYFSHNCKYKNLYFIIWFMIVLAINHICISDWYKTIASKMKNIIKIVFFIVISMIEIISLVMNFLHKEDINLYNDSVVARTDVLIDDIKQQYPNAKILVYEKDMDVDSIVINTILGYDYILIPDSTMIPDSSLEFIFEESNVGVYKISSDYFFDYDCAIDTASSIFSSNLDAEYPFEKMNELATGLTAVDDIYVREDDNIEINNDEDDSTDFNKVVISYSFDKEGDYYTNLREIINLGKLSPGEKAEIKYKCPNDQLRKYLDKRESVRFDKNSFDEYYKNLQSLRKKIIISNKELRIESLGEKDGLLIPYDISRVFVDENGNSCFKSLSFFNTRIAYIEKNSLGMQYSYRPVMLIKGFVFFAVSLSALVVIVLVRKMKTDDCYESAIKKINGKVYAFLYSNRVFVYIIFINLIFYLVALIYSQCIPFGQDSFVTSDGYVISYPVLRGVILDIKNNQLTIPDYSIGAAWDGMTLVSLIIIFINPLKFVLFFMNENNSLFIYNLYYMLNFLLVGPSLGIYLINRPRGKKMQKTELKLVPISLAYSLSSFVMVYYSFSEFLEFAYVIPIIVLGVERLVYEKKCILYTFVLSLFMMSSTYYAFILCELLVLYFFTLDFKDAKEFFKSGIRFALCSIASACMAIFALVPFYINTQNCGYVENDSKAIQVINVFTQSILKSINDVDMSYVPVIVSDEWNRSNAYCGMVVFTIAPLILLVSNIPLKNRIKRYVLVILLYLSFGNQLLNFILHGFHFQTLVPNRFACFYIFLILVIFYDVIMNYKEIYKNKGVLLFTVFSGLFLAILFYVNDFNAMICMKTAIFVVVYLLIVLTGYKTKKSYSCTKIVLIVLVIELIVSSKTALDSRIKVDFVSQDAIKVMEGYMEKYTMKDDFMCRTEILNIDNHNSSKMIKSNSVSMLSSIVKSEQSRLMGFYNANYNTNNIEYGVGNPLSNVMLNVKYYTTEGKNVNVDLPNYFETIDEVENIWLYDDPYVEGAGVILPCDFNINGNNKVSAIAHQNSISNALIGEDLYTDIEDEVVFENTEGGVQVYATIPDGVNGDIYGCDAQTVRYYGYTKPEYSYTFGSLYTRGLEEDEEEMVEFALLNEDALCDLSEYMHTHSLSDYSLNRSENEITAHYDSAEEGKLMIPIPAYKNWRVSIDGVETSFDDSAGGLTIPVPAGEHEVKVRYVQDSNLPYYIISLVSFVLFMISMCFYSKKLKNESDKDESKSDIGANEDGGGAETKLAMTEQSDEAN